MFRLNGFMESPHLMEGEGAAAGGGSAPAAAAPTAPVLPADVMQGLRNLVERQGGSDRAAELLYGENHQHRTTIEDLKKKLPPEGAVVLSGDDVKKWQGYSQHGEPKDIATAFAERDDYKGKYEGLLQEVETGKVAAQVGYKPDVLLDLARSKGFAVALRDKTEGGKAVKVAVAITKDGEKDVETPLEKFVQDNLASYVPALQVAEQPAAQGAPHVSSQERGGVAPGVIDDTRRAELSKRMRL